MGVSIETVKRKHRNRLITVIVMVAAFCAVVQPVLPECSMTPEMVAMDAMTAGDCAMGDSDSTAAGSKECRDCPVAFCFSPACSAQLNALTLSYVSAFKFVSQSVASETILTGRTLTPPGHPPKA